MRPDVKTDHTFFIAEAGVNHNGSLAMALELVDVAADAGADSVKFQTFRAADLVAAHAPLAAYQAQATGGSRQLEMLRALELDEQAHRQIAVRCKERGIAFMSTAFDVASLRLLATFDMPATKIPSGDVTAAPLLLEAAAIGRPLIVSTGMCTLAEIKEALGVIAFGLTRASAEPSRNAFATAFASPDGQRQLRETVTLLHCVTDYPAAVADVHLRAMDVLRSDFGLRVGYSDHCTGIAVALAAVARGATVIEKHITLDKKLPGPDHAASLEPEELKQLVAGIREIEQALGEAKKSPSLAELDNRRVARRSLVAARPIARGEKLDETNIVCKRPGTGIAPIEFWNLLGTQAKRSYVADELIESD